MYTMNKLTAHRLRPFQSNFMSHIGQARVENDRTIRWNALERIVENVHGRVTKSTHQLYFET